MNLAEWVWAEEPNAIASRARRDRGKPPGFVLYTLMVTLSEDGAWLACVQLDGMNIHMSENESKQAAKGACEIAVTISERIRNP